MILLLDTAHYLMTFLASGLEEASGPLVHFKRIYLNSHRVLGQTLMAMMATKKLTIAQGNWAPDWKHYKSHNPKF